MSRLPLLVTLAVTASSLALLTPHLAAADTRPNIVFILTDDQTLEELRVMPNTEHLIGDAGTTFTNYVDEDPLCCPSRATLLSGQYVFHHHVLSNVPPYGGYGAFDNSNALPVWLQDAGYKTIHIGKYLNGYGVSATDTPSAPPGWTDWQGLLGTSYYHYRIDDNGTVVHYGGKPRDYQTDVLADRAVQAIDESANTGTPFFLNIWPHAPHNDNGDPPLPPPRYLHSFDDEPLPDEPAYDEADVSDKPAYIRKQALFSAKQEAQILTHYRDELDTLLAVDDLVGRVVGELQNDGVLDNTVIMFSSDNGYMHGQHRLAGGKTVPYEESVRVPFLARGPGFPAGSLVDAPTANIDFAPTVVALAGATAGRKMDGLDLRSVVADPAAFADRGILMESYAVNCWTAYRTASAVYVRDHDGEEELYDLNADPYELTSQHANPSYAALKADLSAKLDAILPDPPQCVVDRSISVGDVTVTEPWVHRSVVVKVPITLNAPLRSPVVLTYHVIAGTAGADDVVLGSGTIALGVGTRQARVPVTVLGDSITEPDEQATVKIDPANGITIGDDTGTVTIHDRPSRASIAVGDVGIWEGNKRDSTQFVPVTLAEPLTTDLTVQYVAKDGTASRPDDYLTDSGSVVIPAGQTEIDIPVRIVGDVLDEPDEYFVVKITVDGVKVLQRVGTVTIYDDDSE